MSRRKPAGSLPRLQSLAGEYRRSPSLLSLKAMNRLSSQVLTVVCSLESPECIEAWPLINARSQL